MMETAGLLADLYILGW